MEITTLLQVFGRLWLIEESQAEHWAQFAFDHLINRQASNTPHADHRDYYSNFYKVNGDFVRSEKGEVQVISISGPVMPKNSCGMAGTESIAMAVRAAAADPHISSIVLDIDSPGGAVAGTHNLAKTIRAAREVKPVVSFAKGMMASAAYWIGASGTEIVANDEVDGHNTMIGSIGTKAMYIDRAGKEGFKVTSIYATKSTRKGAYQAEIESGNFERVIAELDAVNEIFHASVKEARAGKLRTRQENVFEGDIYTVNNALAFGLVDRKGSLETAVKRSLQLAKTIKR